MARCLVLGANGFLGSHLVDALVEKRHEVRAFGRFGDEPVFVPSDAVEVVRGDFMNKDDLARALQDIEYVFHFISTTTPMSTENDPLVDVETNIRMSIVLFQLCAEMGIKRVIYASTGGAIYGGGSQAAHQETDNPEPYSPYAIGKLTIEHYLRYFKVKHGLQSVTFRISNPYGERQPMHRKQGVIPIFLENICNGKPLLILGDGTMVRDYIYVKDMANMVASTFDKPFKHSVYNIGSGQGHAVNELVTAIEAVSGMKAEITHADAPPTFIHDVVLDVTRFTEEFHIRARTELAEGLKITFDYIKEGLRDVKS